MDHQIKIGFAPTRRRIFSAQDAQAYKDKIRTRLSDMNVSLVDIEDINEEGLVRGADDVDPVVRKFQAEKVDALFLPHCNFGSEHSCGKIAKTLNVPTLLWGPRDEAPLEDGSRLRDSQCGLFATGKVLRRMRVPFSYLPNCRLDDALFEKGFLHFLAVANVVKEFRRARILQISARPADFWTMMCNEGELLERFGIQIFPISLVELADRAMALAERPDEEVRRVVSLLREKMDICIPDKDVQKVAALKAAMKYYALENKCSAVAIQCWDALQQTMGIMPCCANALMTDEGIPVACETDIHGAITSVMVQAAGMGKTPTFFVDWTVRHPTNDNGELLQHCGPWPLSLAEDKPKLTRPFAFPERHPGSVSARLRDGLISCVRFDGDNGAYSMLLGTAQTIEGPYTNGTYCWIEVPNWLKLETMLVKGPYVHHAVCIHGDVTPVLFEALTYIPGVKADFYDEDQEKAARNFLLEADS